MPTAQAIHLAAPMPSLRTPLAVAALLLVGGCSSFVTGTGELSTAALEKALHADLDGFAPTVAPAAPSAVCGSSADDYLEAVAAAL